MLITGLEVVFFVVTVTTNLPKNLSSVKDEARIYKNNAIQVYTVNCHHKILSVNKTWGTLLVLALLQVLANKLYKTYREKIFNTW